MTTGLHTWPRDFTNRMHDWLGEEASAFFAALAKRDVGLRLNPQRGPLDLLKARIPWKTQPVPWCPEGLWLQEDAPVGNCLLHTTGVYYVQDPSAMAAGVLLDPQPDEWILDLAAAPGGKATQIAARMRGEGVRFSLGARGLAKSGASLGVYTMPKLKAPGQFWPSNSPPQQRSAGQNCNADGVLEATYLTFSPELERTRGEGVLVANEVSRRRASVLAMNLERMGVTNAMVVNETPERLAARWPGLFDAVLVDAPCSGEGTFARDVQALRTWSLSTMRGYAYRQKRILDEAAQLVRRGGRLLYGTCTFSPEENEGVIADFLAQHPDFEIADLPQTPGLNPGHPEWIGAPDELRRTGRFWPHTGPGHGHFYALLRRNGDPPDDLPERWNGTDVPGRILGLYRKSMGEILVDAPPTKGLFLSKSDDLYVIPMSPKLWQGLRVLRPGWWVASLRHNKVFPDHALALALRAEDARIVVDLARDDPRLAQYLRGGFWLDDGAAGYVLITVDGFPLGWGKRDGNRLRSRYPVHLRR